MSQRRTILFVIQSLSYGGEERLIVDQLKTLDASKYKLNLLYYEDKEDLLYEVPSNVSIFKLKKENWTDFFRLVWEIRKIIILVKPHVVFSAIWYNTLLVSVVKIFSNLSFYFIAREPHNHLQDIRNTRFEIIKKILIKWSHKIPDQVVIVSKGAARDIQSSYHLSNNKIKVIYNSVDIKNVSYLAKKKSKSTDFTHDNRVKLVTLGRLAKRKGYNYLLSAFKEVRKLHNAILIFIGDGEESGHLFEMTKSMNINGDVFFLGKQKNPYGIIAQCDIFIMSSLWEGFGNVIIEAMACGVPVISTSCPHGPSEIITSGFDGLLVPVKNSDALAEAIDFLIIHKNKRIQLGENGKIRAKDFEIEKIMRQYEAIYNLKEFA